MSLTHSLGEILENLERQIAVHREQADLHARQEEHHREQRALHEAQLETVAGHFESLKAVAVPAAELFQAGLTRSAPAPAAPAPVEDSDVGPNTRASTLVARVLARRPAGEAAGPTLIVAEINRRFQDRWGRVADVRNVSAVLRRMHRQERIRLVREGRSYHEALYAAQLRPEKEVEEPGPPS